MTTIHIDYRGRSYDLTTDSSQSSYDEPVLVDADGVAHKRGDVVVRGEMQTRWEVFAHEITANAIVSDWQRYVFAQTRHDPDIDGLIAKFLGRKSTPYWMTEEWLDMR